MEIFIVIFVGALIMWLINSEEEEIIKRDAKILSDLANIKGR